MTETEIQAPQAGAENDNKPLKVPPLSDAMARLLKLSDSERLETRRFELLAIQDPAAVARLMALAGTAYYCRGARIATVHEAINKIGTQASFDALLTIFTMDLVMDGQLMGLRNFLTQHIFSVLATARKMSPFAIGEDQEMDNTQLAMLVILDKLGVAMALGRPGSAALPVLMEAMRDRQHRFHRLPVLDDGFRFSSVIAQAWDMPETTVAVLGELAQSRDRFPQSAAGQLVLLAEAVVDARHGRGNEALKSSEANDWPMLQALYQRGIDPMSLVVML